jgi:YbbR domain-containing protein
MNQDEAKAEQQREDTMNYTIKALFLALVMFLMVDLIKTAHENQSRMPSTYKAFAELSCGDICK